MSVMVEKRQFCGELHKAFKFISAANDMGSLIAVNIEWVENTSLRGWQVILTLKVDGIVHET